MPGDNQLNGAINVALSTNRNGKVGRRDLDDLYRFNLSGRSSLGVNLSKISKKARVGVEIYKLKLPLETVRGNVGNIDFSLIDRSDLSTNFELIRAIKARNPKGANIALNPLESGDYVIRIRQNGKIDSKYRLSLSGALIEEPTLPLPPVPQTPIVDPTLPNPVPVPVPIPPPPPIPIPEDGNSLAGARPLGFPFTAQSGFVNDGDQQDYYKFSVPSTSAGDYKFDLSGLTANANVEILDVNGGLIKTTTTLGSQTESLLVPLNEGSYFARVFQGTPGATSNYSLSLSLLTDGFTGTLAGGESTASLLTPTTVLGVLASNYVLEGAKNSTEDLFKIVVAPGDRKFLNLELKGISGGSLTGNLDVELFGADGFTPTANTSILTSSRSGNSAEVFGGTLDEGTYYIRIKPGTVGTREGSEYSLSLSLNPKNSVPTITRDINYGKTQILDANDNVIGESGNSSDAKLLTKVGGLAYFSANDGGDTALWKTDGTLKGTQKLKTFSGSLSNFTEANGFLYFAGDNGLSGTELWRSDGTASGTVLVKDLRTGSSGSSPTSLTSTGGRLYFLANNASDPNAQQFYRTNVAGTDVELVPLTTDPTDPVYGVGNLAFYNNTLYFSAEQGADSSSIGKELWRIDNPGDASPGAPISQDLRASGSSNPNGFVFANGKLYASAILSGSTSSLVKIDGSGATSVQTGLRMPKNFVAVGNTLYFSGNTSDEGTELWKLDTTTDQASLLNIASDITESGTLSSNPNNLVKVGTSVYFFADANDGTGEGLWKVDDGSMAPTRVSITDISNGLGTNPEELVAIDGTLYFSADNATKGRELWSYNTATSAMKLIDINMKADPEFVGNTFGSNPGRLTNIGGALYFIADNGLDGIELMSL
ncbi:MAG: hypothetical protein HC781_04415 [Leptolyngbyaceae cyanobacterium CSU_1_4]|nr:hypothetical protein [Leptolyngbyaceae cyanobacterium CSU_1_4]